MKKKSEDAEITRAAAEMARQFGDQKQADLLMALAENEQRTDEEIDLLSKRLFFRT
jgi:ferritin-like metal-binding protein YciE